MGCRALAILELQNVSKVYHNSTKALSNISFGIEQGEFVAVIGPSGAGKSTMLRCINRLVDPTEGTVVVDGQDVTHIRGKALRRVRTKTGMIFQHYNLVNRLSVIENVLHGRLGYKSALFGAAGIYTEAEKKQAFVILEKLGLTDQAYKRCDALSGGQKQRVGIARALMQKPKLILCDEPIASLDPNASKIIMDYLQDINRTMNITCIVNLHQVDVAVQYAKRIIGITAGELVFDGSPEELTSGMLHKIYQSHDGDLITDLKECAV
ncbi:MAG: phosphonate ABC transporter ATP-binding protein [Oscillospiraceae bacterium]